MLIFKIISIVSYIFFIPIFLLSSALLITTTLVYPHFFYILDKFCCRMIMLVFFIWPKIKGKFPREGTYIIMMNHSSFIDVFIFPLIPWGYYTGVSAAKNFKIPIFSALLRSIQAIPIERKNRGSAIESIRQAEKVLKQNIHIGILPEGTRSINGKVSPLKKGGFHMAINTNTPIVPVGVSGAYSFKPKNRWWTRPVPITINIGEVINTNTYNKLDLVGLKDMVEERLKLLSGEKYENK